MPVEKNCDNKNYYYDIKCFSSAWEAFPVLLNSANRYQVYLEMNRLNYGVISLYHTMIEPINNINNIKIQEVSDKILNLPVHQDIGKEEIYEMYDALVELLR